MACYYLESDHTCQLGSSSQSLEVSPVVSTAVQPDTGMPWVVLLVINHTVVDFQCRMSFSRIKNIHSVF